jgi:hypothetical protein
MAGPIAIYESTPQRRILTAVRAAAILRADVGFMQALDEPKSMPRPDALQCFESSCQ